MFQQEIAAIEPQEVRTDAMQITTSWMEEGQQMEALKLVQRQLQRRFGTLNPEVRERLTELSTERLEDLGEALLDFQSKEDLTHWLDNTQPQ